MWRDVHSTSQDGRFVQVTEKALMFDSARWFEENDDYFFLAMLTEMRRKCTQLSTLRTFVMCRSFDINLAAHMSVGEALMVLEVSKPWPHGFLSLDICFQLFLFRHQLGPTKHIVGS